MRTKLIAIVIAAAFPLAAMAAPPETRSGNTGASGSAGVGASTESSGGVRDMGTTKPREPGSKPAKKRSYHALDTDKDGYVSREEAKASADWDRRFNELDKDGDGRLSASERPGSRRVGASGSSGVGSSTESSGGVRDMSAPRRNPGSTEPSGGKK